MRKTIYFYCVTLYTVEKYCRHKWQQHLTDPGSVLYL